MAEGRKRQALSLKRKIEIINAVEASPHKKKKTLAEEFQIQIPTLYNIIRDKEKYMDQFTHGTEVSTRKRSRGSSHEAVDTELFKWFTKLRSERVPVSGPMLKRKAEELSWTLGQERWQCSDGWLHRWKKRHGIAFRPTSGELAASHEGAGSFLDDILVPTLHKYEARNVFYLNKTALFWRLLPDKTFAFKGEKCLSGKKSKERITVMICCNIDGSEKLPLLVVGRFVEPRCFHGVEKLPVDYRATPTAWLTKDIFHQWLLAFDTQMQQQNRQVLLILDNCSAFKISETNAVNALFLPANATSKTTLGDVDINRKLKVQYRKAMVSRLLAHISAGVKANEYHFSLLEAVCTLRHAWGKLSPSTITNSFRRAGCGVEPGTEPNDSSPPDSKEDEKQESLLAQVFKQCNISSSDYFSVDDDVATSGPTTCPGVSAPLTSPVEETVTEAASDEAEDCGDEDSIDPSQTLITDFFSVCT